MEVEFQNLEVCFQKRQVSFLVIKTVKCKSGSLTQRPKLRCFLMITSVSSDENTP